ncbi:MAG: hypothetical protein Q7S16_02070 [bacterium]|nr:hypothetical protein [bacterium]
MIILPLHHELDTYVRLHGLGKKFQKQKKFFESNPLHPSLHTEILEPRQYRFYSFRLDRRYRAIFIYRSVDTIEVIDINDHYR